MLLDSYKVLIPSQIMESSVSSSDKEAKVIRYLKDAYPERYLIEIDGKYAICGLR